MPVLEKLPKMIKFYSSIYGRYPFDAVGAIVDDAKNVGYSLETQTKPVFDRPSGAGVGPPDLHHAVCHAGDRHRLLDPASRQPGVARQPVRRHDL